MVATLTKMSVEARNDFISKLSDNEIVGVLYDWEWWARPEQIEPPGDWTFWLVKAGRGFGKMLDIDTDIRTEDGWKKLKDVKDGDKLFDNKGNICKVLKAHRIQKENAYKLYFDTGEKIICCGNHLWYTISKLEDKQIRRGKLKKGSVRTTNEIAKTIKYKTRETNHRIPITKSLKLPDIKLPIDPYVFGIWLGDGESKAFSITTRDKEILDSINKKFIVKKAFGKNLDRYPISNGILPKRNEKGQFATNKSLYSILKKLNVYKNKHIPDIYKNSSIEQRLELLKGLMDSDGYCGKNGWNEIVTTNKNITEDIFELVSSLGIKARIYEGKAAIGNKIYGTKYRIFFKTDIAVYKLKRKLNRQLNATKAQLSRHKNRFIVKAEKFGEVKMRCLTVDSPNGLFLITKSLIATHNTRTGAEWIRKKVGQGFNRIGFIAPTAADCRDIMVEGESGILATAPPWNRPLYEPSKRRLTWPNGIMATTYSAEEPDRLRGPQHEILWCDEIGHWKYPEAWDMAKLGLRLGSRPQAIVTTTPKPVRIVKELIADKDCVITGGSTYDNIVNLAAAFYKTIVFKYEGTRLGRQEIHAELLEDTPGALWTRKMIDDLRVRKAPELARIVVAIDPAVTSGEGSAETGIIVGGLGVDGHGYVFQDLSCRMRPNLWAKRAVNGYHNWEADRIIGEVNNGGDLVETIIKTVDENVPYQDVWASRGKRTRAEPISSLYEQGRIHHVGTFQDLEDQQCSFLPEGSDVSPDRVDALVWCFTFLMLKATTFRIARA